MDKIKILLADQNEDYRVALVSMLKDVESFEVVGTTNTGRGILENIKVLFPDVLLLNNTMPDLDELTITRLITDLYSHAINIIIITDIDNPKHFELLIEAGIKGLVFQKNIIYELPKAIKMVSEGEYYYQEEMC